MQTLRRDGELFLTLKGAEIDLASEAVEDARRRSLSPIRRLVSRRLVSDLSGHNRLGLADNTGTETLRLRGYEAKVTARALGSMTVSAHYPEVLESVQAGTQQPVKS